MEDKQVGGDHYLRLGIQPLEAMECWMTDEQYEGFLLGSVIKYIARYNAQAVNKGGTTDLRKAQHYLEKLIALEEARTSD